MQRAGALQAGQIEERDHRDRLPHEIAESAIGVGPEDSEGRQTYGGAQPYFHERAGIIRGEAISVMVVYLEDDKSYKY